MYFLFSKAGNFETSITRVPYNKLLTNLACSSRTGEYWPSVVFVRTSLRSVRTATTSGQYSPVRPSRSVSKRLLSTLRLLAYYIERYNTSNRINRMLYTNEKLHKIGFISHKDCTFCKSESETLTHLLYHCPFYIAFWKDFEAYWSLAKTEQIHLTLEDIIVGIMKKTMPLLNYFLTD